MVLEKGKPRVARARWDIILDTPRALAAQTPHHHTRSATSRRATEPPSASFDMHPSIEIAANNIAIVTDYFCHTHPMM